MIIILFLKNIEINLTSYYNKYITRKSDNMFINNTNINNDTNIDSSFNKEKTKNKINIKLIIIIVSAVLLVILGIIFIPKLFNSNSGESTFILNGGDITIYKDSNYIDLGYVATNGKGLDIGSKVVIDSNVNTSEVGEYNVTYKLGKKELKRRVTVVNKTNITTIITLNGGTSISINLGEDYNDQGVTILDSTSKNLEDKVVQYGKVDINKKGTYRLIYTFTNSENVTIVAERIVTVE